eukprot:Colp12_sorted_trinity150504_noHs@22401
MSSPHVVPLPSGNSGTKENPVKRTLRMMGFAASASNTSLLGSSYSLKSAAIKDQHRDQVAIKGPIAFQTFIHYMIFLPLLAIAESLGQATHIVYEAFGAYLVVAIICAQMSRLIYFRNQLSLVPFYLSFFPFLFMTVLSREAHQQYVLLWFNSLMTIAMQSGVQSSVQVFLTTAMFAVCYAGTIWAMKWFYTDSSGDESFRGFKLEQSIEWKNEIAIFLIIFFLGVAYMLLVRYIRRYAQAVALREKNIGDLYRQNQDLRRQINEMQEKDPEKKLDVNSPITKVIMVLRSIQQTSGQAEAEELENVIRILASNHSATDFILDANAEDMDHQTGQWLHNMLQVDSGRTLQHATSSVGFLNTANPVKSRIRRQRTQKSSVSRRDSLQNAGLNSISEGEGGLAIPSSVSNDKLVDELLALADTLEFDIFKWTDLCNGRPLSQLAFALFEQNGLIQLFNIDTVKFENFLTQIENGYHARNPYHNAIHAADVLQFSFYLSSRPELKETLTAADILALLVSSIIHDFDHPGKNNAFLINTSDPLAVFYNDKSVLENHHCAAGFMIMKKEECNIFSNVTREQYRELRDAIVTAVMATDAAMHYDYLGRFKAKTAAGDFNASDSADRKMLTQFAIKCADMSNPARRTEISTKWTALIMEEFFRQGDMERELNMPVSMFMDRHNSNIPKCQCGFIDFLVAPMFDAMHAFMPLEDALGNMKQNRKKWEEMAKCLEPPKDTTSVAGATK